MGFLSGVLSAADIQALADFLATQQPPDTPKGLYDANCLGCHGDPFTGPTVDSNLLGVHTVAGARTCSIDAAIFGNPEAKSDESPFPNGVPAMQFLQGLTAEQIQKIADHLNSQFVSGERRYVTACAGCHGIDASGGFVDEGVRGKDAGEIREYIDDEKAMRFLGCLPRSDTDQMGNYLRGLKKD
jgi:mono/diheme cytochrome c family protein